MEDIGRALDRDRFLTELRKALHHLYDPAVLQCSPLIALFGLDKRANPHTALRRLITDAIRKMKPEDTVPLYARAWRIYHVLAYRYVEQSEQRTVAFDLGLSVRQLRRQERLAERVLAEHLWKQYGYDLEAKAQEAQGLSPPLGGLASFEEGEAILGPEEELKRLRQSLPSETTKVDEFVKNVIEVAKPLLREAGVEVRCQIPHGLPPLVVQLLLLRQAFLNLLTFSARAVPQGQVHITAETIPPVLYIRFYTAVDQASSVVNQNDDVRQWKEQTEIASQLVKAFGGDLKLSLKPNNIITAQFALPIVQQRIRVLVIDDNADTLLLFERYFSGTRYEFAGVRDPEQALTLAESLSPQIIVLDVMLPGIDGWELLGRVREHPLTRHTPIIVCTILPQEELAYALGAAAFIRKPVSREKLLSVLDQQITSLGPGL